MSDWPPRSEDGLHGATFEWDGPHVAVRCICGFYRITDTHERAEMEYLHHIPAVSGGGGQVPGDVVARAKAALEGVTPGPWAWNFPEGRGDDSLKSTTHITPYHGGRVHDGKSGYPTEVIGAVWHNDDTAGIAGEPADLAFIAAARSLIPELVAEVERLRWLWEHGDSDHMCEECWPSDPVPAPQCSGCGGSGGDHRCLRGQK